MIMVLVAVAMLFAAFAWVLAVLAAIRVIGMAPKGQRLRTYGQLGWWRFDDIRATTGEQVAPHLRLYQRAFVAFLVCIFVVAAVSVLLAITQQN